ncbi:uroporphyrinogen-III synthase [Halobacillus karajensis]|uniref:Uroporphyrinogen-III synthase n=1 Tax=Halobacillus karajensis TaxID=195088 RepID=A0A024P7A3_9BACI|nr:uroporphyrinogen-III synthase [Halobacillus karajensis]CDQ18189.1 uroporphyrinogen-III synthase [Halobacillus karajensis]CDQ24541.1 uroporphyrinogen-III synthase [Halobacillus karajensis]CDQ29212.1 uroporphyrinogen-III synthase [Halobacillus karajensis]SEH57566.1 uroporphyrinogen-III synthase [Halobacillus karajensis]
MIALQGKRILVTRSKSQANPLIKKIEEEGGVPYHTPLLNFQLNASESHEGILNRLHDYSWVFLTSANGVKFFFKLLKRKNVSLPKGLKFAIVGSKTERALKRFGYQADFIPSRYRASTMGEEFFDIHPDPGMILYIRGNRSRDVLPDIFKDKGVFFQSMTVYDTLLVKETKDDIIQWVEEHSLDALTFTSPSIVHAYMIIVKDIKEKGLDIPCFCIGPTTAKTAKEHGFRHIHVPDQYTMNHMFNQMIHYFSNEGKR